MDEYTTHSTNVPRDNSRDSNTHNSYSRHDEYHDGRLINNEKNYRMSKHSEHINDLWEDMDRLNAMYEELMWDNDDVLEFVADYKNNQIVIRNRTQDYEKT